MIKISSAQLYERLGVMPEELEAFCARSPIIELAFFGSVLRDDFRSDSDIDVLVELVPDSCRSLMDFVGLQFELEELFGRKVDLVERKVIEDSHNWIRRKAILESSQVVYESRQIVSA